MKCVCVWLGAMWKVGVDKWIRGLALGLTNPVGKREVLDVSLCLGCSAEGGVCG